MAPSEPLQVRLVARASANAARAVMLHPVALPARPPVAQGQATCAALPGRHVGAPPRAQA